MSLDRFFKINRSSTVKDGSQALSEKQSQQTDKKTTKTATTVKTEKTERTEKTTAKADSARKEKPKHHPTDEAFHCFA